MNNSLSVCFALIAQALLQCSAEAASVQPVFTNDTVTNMLSFNDTFGHNVTVGSYNASTGLWTASGVAGGFTNLIVSGNATVAGTTGLTGLTTVGAITINGVLSGSGVSTYLASPPSIGSTAANSGAFTTLSATGALSGAGFNSLISAPPVGIGSVTPNGGAFTSLSASGAVSGSGFANYLLSPPAIGNSTPNTGAFTTLSASSTVSGAGFTALFASPSPIGSTLANTGAFTTITSSGNATLNNSILGGQGSTNANAGPFPGYLYGIGGTGFYSANTLANSSIFNQSGSVTIANPQPYGMLNSAVGASFTTGSARPPCVNGFTAPSQVGFSGVENGAVAACMDADTQPVMVSAAGTFTATTFTPTTPIPQTAAIFAAVGMWVRSSDVPSFSGQITSFTVNGSNQITLITVSNWYQEGQAGGAGTPAGSTLYLNPQDKVWASLHAIYLNRFQVTGNVANGSPVISSVSSTANIYDNGEWLQTATNLFPTRTWIVSHTANSITVNANATGTLVGETLNISAGSAMNRGVANETDIFNNVPAQTTPIYVTGTCTTTTGSFICTSVTNVSSLYPHLMVRATANLGQENEILAVNIAGSTFTMSQKAIGNGSVTYQARSRFDEGGAGQDCLTTAGFFGQTCFNQRGLVTYGYKSNGATIASFISQPDSLGINVPYGFLVDQTLGSATSAPFALVNANGATTLFSVDTFGNVFTFAVELTPSAIAGLPACSAGTKGLVKFVSDTVGSAVPTYHLIVAAGGATTVNSLASCNGTNWVYD